MINHTTDKKAKPWYYGHRQRMAEKIATKGIDSLTESELLEELLMRAIPRRDVKPIVRDLLSEFKTLSGVMSAKPAELCKISGIKDGTVQFFGVIRRIAQEMMLGKVSDRPVLSNLEHLLDYVNTLYVGVAIETLYIFYLDAKLKLIKVKKECTGSVNHIPIAPREILKEALILDASNVIMVHNHPSGDSQPSVDDIRTTETIDAMLGSAGICLAEHLVIGSNRKFHSMRAQGILARQHRK